MVTSLCGCKQCKVTCLLLSGGSRTGGGGKSVLHLGGLGAWPQL